MGWGGSRFGVWVGLVCAVPLTALVATLLFNAPTLPTSIVAFMALGLIAPHLLLSSSREGQDTDAQKPGPGR